MWLRGPTGNTSKWIIIIKAKWIAGPGLPLSWAAWHSGKRVHIEIRPIWLWIPLHMSYMPLDELLMFLTISFLFWKVNISQKVIRIKLNISQMIYDINGYSVNLNFFSFDLIGFIRWFKKLLVIFAFGNHSVWFRMRFLHFPNTALSSDSNGRLGQRS